MSTEISRDYISRQVDWDKDAEKLRNLFNTSWIGHSITKKSYFDWHLLKNYKGRAIAFCAIPNDQKDIFAGIYLVIPTTLLIDNLKLNFSTSMYTITHPLYYKRGIFKELAKLTYNKCSALGIQGTVGVPNNNSIVGFKRLGFVLIGRFELMARFAFPVGAGGSKIVIRELYSENDMKDWEFTLDHRKAEAGVILADRSDEFIKWRFFRCPGVNYRVFIAVDSKNSIIGTMVLRFTKRHRIPITVIVDFLLDHTSSDCDLAAKQLLKIAHVHGLKKLAPIVVSLVNPFSHEGIILKRYGYKKVPKQILPHDTDFILKCHGEQSEELRNRLSRFESWHFSFADFDIF